MDRDNITRIGARASRVEELISSNGGALPSRLFGHSAGHKALATECTKGRCKPRVVWSMLGASLTYATWGKALPDSLQMPAFQPYWGKPAVRDDRGDGGNGGIIRSPISRHRPTRQRKEIGSEKSWQIEYIPGHFERREHVRKKYACPSCEHNGENPQIAVAAKAETAIEKGFAGPGLLAFIVTSKFADYLPLYRLEDIFERQGFEISRATQSVWCGDVADVVEPLYQRMAERVRKSHVVATDDTVLPMLSPGHHMRL